MNNTVNLPTIYRGDSVPTMTGVQKIHRGRTFADLFITEGLIAKAADGGLSHHLNKPLEELVLVHVGYGNIQEQQYKAYHSPLISFTSMEDEAFSYMNRRKKDLIECDLSDATHFIWRLSGVKADEIGPGLFRFMYIKNVEHLKTELRPDMPDHDLFKAISQHIVHDLLKEKPTDHVAIIVDSVTFLDNLPASGVHDLDLLHRAKERAAKSYEWLVYTNDPMPDGRGFQNRFQLNEHLYLHEFFRIGSAK
jgi:hypothetical protein